jgi:hypothetical protein
VRSNESGIRDTTLLSAAGASDVRRTRTDGSGNPRIFAVPENFGFYSLKLIEFTSFL